MKKTYTWFKCPVFSDLYCKIISKHGYVGLGILFHTIGDLGGNISGTIRLQNTPGTRSSKISDIFSYFKDIGILVDFEEVCSKTYKVTLGDMLIFEQEPSSKTKPEDTSVSQDLPQHESSKTFPWLEDILIRWAVYYKDMNTPCRNTVRKSVRELISSGKTEDRVRLDLETCLKFIDKFKDKIKKSLNPVFWIKDGLVGKDIAGLYDKFKFKYEGLPPLGPNTELFMGEHFGGGLVGDNSDIEERTKKLVEEHEKSKAIRLKEEADDKIKSSNNELLNEVLKEI